MRLREKLLRATDEACLERAPDAIMRRAMLHGVSISGTAAEELANESVAELLSAAVLPNLAGSEMPSLCRLEVDPIEVPS